MKKIALLLVVVMAMFVFVGCADDEEDETATTEEETTTTEEETTTTSEEETTEAPDEVSGRMIVPMSAEDVVPPLDTGAAGTAVFMLTPDQTGIDYAIYTEGLEDITAAHIHQGAPDENGPVLIWLYPEDQVPSGETTTTEDGAQTTETTEEETTTTTGDDTTETTIEEVEGELLVQGMLTQQALDAAGDITMEELTQMILSGQTYVQVHTEENPGGALRGQILVAPTGGMGLTTTTSDELMEDDELDEEMDGVTTTTGS